MPFTAGQVSIGQSNTPPPALASGIPGFDPANFNAIVAGEAANTTTAVYENGGPPIPVSRSKLPSWTQTALSGCDSDANCKFVAADFDAGTGTPGNVGYMIDTSQSTVHNAGIFYKDTIDTSNVNAVPMFTSIPGYIFDPIFSFNNDAHPGAFGTVIDERYCARSCDANTQCIGFNYEVITKKCTVYTDSNPSNPSYTNDVYKDGTVAFLKEQNATTASGSDPHGTNLSQTGIWCGDEAQVERCNADISNVIQNTNVTSFSTGDLTACAACPAKTVVKTGTSSWAVTNEIQTTTIKTSANDVITATDYTRTGGRASTTIALEHGKFYKIAPYLPSCSMPTKTCLYMKRDPKYSIPYGFDNSFYMNENIYRVPDGDYYKADILTTLNSLVDEYNNPIPGQFSYDETNNQYVWDGSGTFRTMNIAGPLRLLGFQDRMSGTRILGIPINPDIGGGFFTYYPHTIYSSLSLNTYFDGETMVVFAPLGSNASATDGHDSSLNATETPFQPMPVDYVDNGFILMDNLTGKYFVPDVDDSNRANLKLRFSKDYNALVVLITESSYANFLAEVSAINSTQPLFVKSAPDHIPYIFDPVGDPTDPHYFQLETFPSQTVWNTYIAANPTWTDYLTSRYFTTYTTSGYVSSSGGTTSGNGSSSGGTTATTTYYTTSQYGSSSGVGSSSGGGGGTTATTTLIDMSNKLTVTSKNFWATANISSRLDLADPSTGCADPNNPGAYTGGECEVAVNGINFCECCAAGTYSPPSARTAVCTVSADGTIKTLCTPCASGSYCPTGSGSEQDCPAGSYCPTPAQKIECPAGFYCPVRSTTTTPCVAGDYCPASSSSNVDCVAGQYCESNAATGTTLWGTSTKQCPAGNYCPARSTAPIPCTDPAHPNIAFYCPPGTRTLNQCPAGYSCSGNTIATPCTPGHYCPWGSLQELSCPANTFYKPVSLTGALAILQAPSLAQLASTVATQGQLCTSCPAGSSANPNFTGCVCASPLVWSAYVNQCIPACPAGQSTNTEGKDDASKNSSTACTTCADGYYTPVDNLPKCIKCASNFQSTSTADHKGCTCTQPIPSNYTKSYTWVSNWNRCRVDCQSNATPFWNTCFPALRTAIPITGVSIAPVPIWECPSGTNNQAGEHQNRTCYTPSDKDMVAAGPLCENWRCSSNWSQNGWQGAGTVDCGTNRSCKRSAPLTYYTCPPCFSTRYYSKSGTNCPPGSTYSSADQMCHITPTYTPSIVQTASAYQSMSYGNSGGR